MKALVTGVAGFIGSHLAEQLLTRGDSVVGLDCFTDFYSHDLKQANIDQIANNHKNFNLVKSSIQEANWKELLSKVTHIFHLAAQPGVRRSWGRDFSIYTTCNIEATQVLLEACAAEAKKIECIVYASSSSVYGDEVDIPMREDSRLTPVSPYGVTKLAAENMCHLYWLNHGLPTVSLRYFTVYGPRQRPDMAFNRFLRAIHLEKPITLYGDGEQTRDFTYVDDAVTATIAAADQGKPGCVYNIGGGSRVSMNHVIELMAQCTGRTPIVDHDDSQLGDMRDTFADTTHARTELQFAPSVTLEKGIQAEYRWIAETPTFI